MHRREGGELDFRRKQGNGSTSGDDVSHDDVREEVVRPKGEGGRGGDKMAVSRRQRTGSASGVQGHGTREKLKPAKASARVNKPKGSAVRLSAQGKSRVGVTEWTDVPSSMPSWVRYGLHWSDGPIAPGLPHWQVVGSKVEAFLYSAHYDDVSSPSLVRVIGLLHKMVAHLNVTCDYHDTLRGPVVHRVSGVAYHFRELSGRKYVGAYIDCPLVEVGSGYLPYAVSVSRIGEKKATNMLIVHYSQSDAWLRARNLTFYERTRKQSGGRRKSAAGQDRQKVPGSGYKWNITRCFPAIQRNYNDHVILAEMVAASLAVGVQRFVFYVESIGPDMLRMLKVLEKRGLAEIHPWNLHLVGNTVFYAAQSSAISDCFYRHLSSSKFVLFGDIDELFVPRQHRSLLPLLNNVLTNTSQCGAVIFRNVFFDLGQPPNSLPRSVDPEQRAVQLGVKMLTHTLRISRIWPAPRRTKPAVNPRRVITAGIHSVHTMRKGFEVCTMDPARGLLQHYRLITAKQSSNYADKEDSYLWRYAQDIITHFQQLIADFNFDAKGLPYPGYGLPLPTSWFLTRFAQESKAVSLSQTN